MVNRVLGDGEGPFLFELSHYPVVGQFREDNFTDGMRRPVSDGMRYAPND
jgi:hypothetical protein